MRIAVAMSGGVDSSCAALLLREQGHDVVGITAKLLLCADMDGVEPRDDVCCSPESIADARGVARRYGFPHVVADVEDDFSREVIDPFCREYVRGRTPSPCITCNARIKFPRLLAIARELGCAALATGHYTRIGEESGRYYVSRGVDPDKDQSYFLFDLSQEVLAQVRFPLGGYRKEEIRALARGYGLSVADKPESQEICFVLDNDYPRYIERRTGTIPPPGDIVDRAGSVLGRHRGVHRYTIGQRRGLGIAHPMPLYVIEIDASRNVIVVGGRDELARRGLVATGINRMKAVTLGGCDAFVKTRSTQPPVLARLEDAAGGVSAVFAEPQAGISPGQAAVFYDEQGDVLGGGWIERAL
ncbi:MAG TPA: tRNA 2-thiouridine(34) synthase MnmA [Spirochaetota bacterium]|nr:tRNA 2-thiouridine(34) synthase MnmA [Spirochaetota bacterium]HNT12363.1 tRNA 2-thiouridine(34) synthase MnmA [Spirochaetota bacterium]